MSGSSVHARILLLAAVVLCAAKFVAGQTIGTINTVAGGIPNNIPALQVAVGYPSVVIKDSAGNLYIGAESFVTSGGLVFKVAPNGNLTTIAGNGSFLIDLTNTIGNGDGGPATNASIASVGGLALDANQNLYIADAGHNTIRRVNASTGVITTVAGGGAGCPAQTDAVGDGCPGTSGILAQPAQVFVDANQNIFIADTGNNRIREVVAASGLIVTIAGPSGDPSCTAPTDAVNDGCLAKAAILSGPTGVFVDSHSNIFISDTQNNRVRKVTFSTGIIQTVAGTDATGYNGDGIAATTATVSSPGGLFVAANGDLYFADTLNGRARVVLASNGLIQTLAGGGSGCSGQTDTFGDNCLATQAFLEDPVGVFLDSSSNLYIADTLTFTIREVTASNGLIQAVAGNGTANLSGDGGLATKAQIGEPYDVAVDSGGNLYIADLLNSRVRKVNVSTHIIQTVAGGGTVCAGATSPEGDGCPASQANVVPFSVFVDGSQNIYISDLSEEGIRKVSASTGIISLVAGGGTGCPNQTDTLGDGCPALQAVIQEPWGIYVDANGNIFFSDFGGSRVREVVAATGLVKSIAGTGVVGYNGDNIPATQAQISSPIGTYGDSNGNIYFSDLSNFRIREIVASTGNIVTVAGNGTPGYNGDNILATNAEIFAAYGIFVDKSGNLFFGDTVNSRIREVLASTGIIQTVAGNGTFGFSGDGGPATSAELGFVYGLAGDSNDNLFFSDLYNNRIREVFGAVPGNNFAITTIALPNGTVGAAYNFGLQGVGGTTPYTWSLVSGTLPPGFSAISSAGVISGTPTAAGSFGFVVKLADAAADVQTKSYTLTINPAAGGSSMTANAATTPQSASVNTGFANALAVTVRDSTNSPVPGVNVTFTAPGAGASGKFSNSTATITVVTNALGVAAAPFTAGATAGGPYLVTAQASGLTTVSFSLTNTAGTASSMTANALSTPQSAIVNTAFANGLAVTVRDSSSNPVSGVVVTFTAPGTGVSGRFSNATSTINVATNASGVAAAPFTANGTAGGPYTVTAAATGLTTVNFSLTNTPSIAASMTANAGTTPQSATVNTAFTNALAVTVRDAASNPVAGVNVTFAAPGTGPSGQFSNSASTITVATNASGVAAAPFTANGTAGGPYLLTAGAAGLTTVSFSLTNTAGVASTISANAGTTPQSATINSSFANALAVTVRDAGANPVSGVNVTFTAPASGASGRFSNSTTSIAVATNASGAAVAPFTANGTAGGPYTVTAAATGLVTVSFSLTNSAPSLQTISLSPLNPSIASGATQQFTATGHFSNGTTQNLTNTVTWASSVTSVAVVSATGLATATTALGTTNITATFGAVSALTTLTVSGSSPSATLAVTMIGTGSGTVTDNLQQIHCTTAAGVQSGTCTAQYPTSATVTLTATPGAPSTFGGWGNACGGTGGCAVALTTSRAVTASFAPPPQMVTLNFAPGSNANGMATYDCPSNPAPSPANPCLDANAHALALAIPQVLQPFSLTVQASEVAPTAANGICPSGATPVSDFDCRFATFFTYQTLTNGDRVVPLCYPYANGNCVHYQVFSGTPGVEPDPNFYVGPIDWNISWNNDQFIPPIPYTGSTPRVYDDPDYAVTPTSPFGTNCSTPMLVGNPAVPTNPAIFCQFEFDITTAFDPNKKVDAAITARTKQFNDVVVAFPPANVGNLTVSTTPSAGNVTPGSALNLNINVANSAGGAVSGATLTDALPAGSSVSWAISPAYGGPGTCGITGVVGAQTLSCTFGTIAASQTFNISLVSANSSIGNYTNTAIVKIGNQQILSIGKVIVQTATSAFSNLTGSQAVYAGDASITLSGTVGSGTSFPAAGETVSITIQGTTVHAAVGASGAFTATFPTASVPASTTPYVISYSYGGDLKLSAVNNTSTTLTVKMIGDVNGDGTVTCADLAIIKASFGKKAGQPGFDPRADINNDGVVNVLDLSVVARQIPAGTACP